MFFTDDRTEEIKVDKYGKKISLEIPSMPIALKEGETKPNQIFQRVQQTGYPPIFAQNTWTKGVLYKDVLMFYKPSETIGESRFSLNLR